MATPFLEVKDLQGWFGESHVLHGVNFHVNEGEVVTLLGRNGAGRTSTMRSIMGLIGRRTGSIRSVESRPSAWRRTRLLDLALDTARKSAASFRVFPPKRT